jgi:hypothetical protein
MPLAARPPPAASPRKPRPSTSPPKGLGPSCRAVGPVAAPPSGPNVHPPPPSRVATPPPAGPERRRPSRLGSLGPKPPEPHRARNSLSWATSRNHREGPGRWVPRGCRFLPSPYPASKRSGAAEKTASHAATPLQTIQTAVRIRSARNGCRLPILAGVTQVGAESWPSKLHFHIKPRWANTAFLGCGVRSRSRVYR